MCRNGQYTERGIKQIDGFMSERWRIEPEYAMKVDPSLGILGVLLEPTTVVAKAWEQVARGRPARLLGAADRARDRRRADRPPRRAARRAARARGARPRPRRRRAEARPRARARRDLPHRRGRRTSGFEPDVDRRVHRRRAAHRRRHRARSGAGGVVCLTGVGSGGRAAGPATADVAAEIVLQNKVIVGSVNANKRHWYKAGEALARADRAWLGRLITRRERPRGLRAGPASAGPTTSRSSSSSPRLDRRPHPTGLPLAGVRVRARRPACRAERRHDAVLPLVHPGDGTPGSEAASRAKELADAGITALWLPPAYKGTGGGERRRLRRLRHVRPRRVRPEGLGPDQVRHARAVPGRGQGPPEARASRSTPTSCSTTAWAATPPRSCTRRPIPQDDRLHPKGDPREIQA